MSGHFASQPLPISGLARLVVKDSADHPGELLRPLTRSYFLLLGRLFQLALPFLLGTFLRSAWSPPFPCHAPTLILLYRQGVAIAHLDSLPPHDLVLWTDGSFPFGKGGFGVLANRSLRGTEATLFFQQAQYAQVFPLKPLCKLFAGLGNTNKSANFLLCDSRSSYLKLWQELSFLSSCFIRLPWVPGHSFLPGNDAADELVRRGALLLPSAISWQSLSSYLSYPLFSFLGLEAYCLI